MTIYKENLDKYGEFMVLAVDPENHETHEGALEAWILQLIADAKTDGKSRFDAVTDKYADGYPWTALYSYSGNYPAVLYLVMYDRDTSPTENVHTKIEYETVLALADKMAMGWLPDEWQPQAVPEESPREPLIPGTVPEDPPKQPRPPPSKPPKQTTLPSPEPPPMGRTWLIAGAALAGTATLAGLIGWQFSRNDG